MTVFFFVLFCFWFCFCFLFVCLFVCFWFCLVWFFCFVLFVLFCFVLVWVLFVCFQFLFVFCFCFCFVFKIYNFYTFWNLRRAISPKHEELNKVFWTVDSVDGIIVSCIFQFIIICDGALVTKKSSKHVEQIKQLYASQI